MLYAPYTMSMGPHGPSRLRQCALARKKGPGGLAPRAGGLGEPSAPQGKPWRVWGAARSPMLEAIRIFVAFSQTFI